VVTPLAVWGLGSAMGGDRTLGNTYLGASLSAGLSTAIAPPARAHRVNQN
jgi:hypothetical protein